MEKEVEAILLDVGDVLALSKKPLKKYKKSVIHHLGVHESVAKKLNISLDQYFDSIDATYAKSIEGRISKKEVLKILSKNFKIPGSKIQKIYAQIYSAHFRQNFPLLNLLFKLKKLGYKIAVLSDQWHLSKKILIPMKIYKKFDALVISCNIGARKPNPQIYLLAAKKLSVPLKKILFIDNQEWNITPAKKLGMKTILFRGNKKLFSDEKWRKLFR